MKILLINKFHYMRGGSETYYFALAEALEKKGHEVVFFAMHDEKNLPCKQEKFFVNNVNYSGKQGIKTKIYAIKNFFYSKDAAEKLGKLIEEEHPDVAHIGLLHRQITFSVVDVLKKHNIPVVMTMHDLIFACPNYTMLTQGKNCEECVNGSVINCIKKKCVKNSTSKSFLAACEKIYLVKKKYYDKIDLYITECNFYKKLMLKSKITNSRIICMSNFLPVSQEYKFYNDYEDYILYFGRFSQEKGILTLLEAHKKLNCIYKLILVGVGPMEEKIREYIENNNITNIELPGAVYGEEMEKIIQKSKTIIVPSEWYENCPYALLQSIARGKIVIASNIGGLPELIDDGNTGFLFKAGDSEELSNKIKLVMSMGKEKYEEMSNIIANEAKNKHNWSNYIDSLIEEYTNLINNNY